MPLKVSKATLLFCILALLGLTWARSLRGSDADTIGATALRLADPTLTGAGIAIIQPEAPIATNTFEINPAAVGLSPSVFTYTNSGGLTSSGTFPNSVGLESSHADSVAGNLTAIAPGVSSIDNYDVNYYIDQIVANGVLPSSVNPALHNGRIVNQSYVYVNPTASDVLAIDQMFDSYAATNNVLFVSAVGNSGFIQAPATAYNGISVNALSLSPPSLGPTSDGRSKPDLTAPGGETSYSTPEVTGAAAILLQAAGRGDGGAGTAINASDIRTLKALLLNGATKPAGWSHTATAPLDPQYGSGIVNVDQSWLELKAGNQTASAAAPTGQLQAPVNLRLSAGWDLGALSDGSTTNHYFFAAPISDSPSDILTATIAWNVSDWDGSNNAILNNLDLALYNATTNSPALVSISDSTIDNVQQLDVTGLVPGDTYDLQVFDAAARVNGGAETYGLAYSAAPDLSVVPEPSTIALLAAGGFCGLAALVRRRKKLPE